MVEPDGAQFKLPMPLLWQHDSEQPIGHVTHAKVGKAGIEIVAKMRASPSLDGSRIDRRLAVDQGRPGAGLVDRVQADRA